MLGTRAATADRAIQLDVTDPASIAVAAERIREELGASRTGFRVADACVVM